MHITLKTLLLPFVLAASISACAQDDSLYQPEDCSQGACDEVEASGCYHNGQLLAEGTQIGGLACTAEGVWHEASDVCEDADGQLHETALGLCGCYHNGDLLPVGIHIGGLVCTTEGIWHDVSDVCEDADGLPHATELGLCGCIDDDGDWRPSGTCEGDMFCNASGEWE